MAAGDLISAAGGQARSVHGNYVSGQYFDTLGVRALLGPNAETQPTTRAAAPEARC